MNAKQRTRIEPINGWCSLELRELWDARGLFATIGGRDLKVRYKQTALGIVWVIAQPLLAAGVFSFVFGNVAGFEAPSGVPYLLYAFVGLMAWNLFSGTLGRSAGSMVGNAHLVSKIYFPRLVLPISTAISSLIDFAVAAVLLVVLLAVFWSFFAAGVLMIPVCVTLLLVLALGLGFIATALSVRFRDVRYIVPVLTQLLIWASPVAYAMNEVPAEYLRYYRLNPLVNVIEAFKTAVLGVGGVNWAWFAYSAIVSLLMFVVGLILFKRLEGTFADVI